MSPGRLCRLDEIADPGSRGFRLGSGSKARAFFIVRHGGRVVAYENVCPHVGSPLDWVPDRFLDIERRFILCATHGALFRIEDGYCLEGPCAGKALMPVRIRVEGGEVYLEE
ncbi:MAG TPA: Rieske (2Fe-2S) protein [Stellaceae bacterium]|nr:Rieske (2Fe-2S) protein [Stellaceae bacterium]